MNIGTNVGRGLAPASGKTLCIRIDSGKFVTTCCTAGASPRPTLWVKRYYAYESR